MTYAMLKLTHISNYLDEFDHLCLLFSTLMHDINHTGKTNSFEKNTFSEYALRYNGQIGGVLEQHHASTAFKILQKKEYNILDRLSYKSLKLFRSRTILNILATDMSKHRKLIDEFG